jgi:hypothetical protein
MAIALFRSNLLYGDLQRWLGGHYTNEDKDWSSIFDFVRSQTTPNPPQDYPPLDITKAERLCLQGAPLAGAFTTNPQSNRAREAAATKRLQNSPETVNDITAKFAKEEKLCQHILVPRFLWEFLPGLLLTLITWVKPKPHRVGDSGRLALDPSNPVLPDDIGTANSQIPNTGTADRLEENPACHYGTA